MSSIIGNIKLDKKNKEIVDWNKMMEFINESEILTDTAKKTICTILKKRQQDETKICLSEKEVYSIYGNCKEKIYDMVLKDTTEQFMNLIVVYSKDESFMLTRLFNKVDYDNGRLLCKLGEGVCINNINDYLIYDEVSLELEKDNQIYVLEIEGKLPENISDESTIELYMTYLSNNGFSENRYYPLKNGILIIIIEFKIISLLYQFNNIIGTMILIVIYYNVIVLIQKIIRVLYYVIIEF